MSINSVSFSFGNVAGTHLSEETKKKLIALGIDPSTVTSEAQAKALITNAEIKQQTVSKSKKTESKTVCTSESEVMTKAKQLAQKAGIKISSTSTIDSILQDLSDKINSLPEKSSEDKISENKKEQYKNELDTIQNEYNAIKQTQNSVYTMLNMTANVNKYMLGL